MIDKESTEATAGNASSRKTFVPYFLKVGKAKKQNKENKEAENLTTNKVSPAHSKDGLKKNKATVLKPVKKRGSYKKRHYKIAKEIAGGDEAEAFMEMSLDERRQIFRDVNKICNDFDAEDKESKKEPIKDVYTIFRDEALKYKLLTGDEEKELAKQIEAGNNDAAQLMVNSNLRLVIACAKQIYNHNKNTTILDFMDLIQEGILGLIVAVKKFDWRRNTRFSTCAVPWIYQHIVRAADSQREGFSVPGYAGFSIRSMNNDIRKYVEGTLDVSAEPPSRLKRIKELAAVIAPIIAIDHKEEPDETPGVLTPEALVSDSASPDDIINDLQETDYKQMLHRKLQSILTPEEYDVLCRRYGMGIYEEFGAAPLRLIAADLGKSIEYTRVYLGQIEEKIRMSKDAAAVVKKWLLNSEENN